MEKAKRVERLKAKNKRDLALYAKTRHNSLTLMTLLGASNSGGKMFQRTLVF